MKKVTLMAILLSLALVACGEKKVEEVKDAAAQTVEQVKETATEATAEVKETAEKAVEEVKDAVAQALKFKTADGVEYGLDVDGDHAVLKTADGKEYHLKADVSASGSRFADENGNEIHFKDGSGIAKIDGKEFNLDLVK
nr:MliC family protein [Fusobacterium gastrosuis]